MANSNGSFGLRPIGRLGSSANTTGTTEYRIASDNSNPIFQGMAVIPLAAGVLYSTGFVLGPAVGAVFMSLSTIIVAINAQLLKGKMRKSKEV